MQNNTVIRKITLTAEYRPLSATPLVASVDISALPTNAGVCYFRGDDGADVPWQAGEWHPFQSVDLSQIFVKGTAGDVVTANGGTW